MYKVRDLVNGQLVIKLSVLEKNCLLENLVNSNYEVEILV